MERSGQIATITSGYRSPEHNREVGGAQRSKHMRGLAVDATVNGQPVTRAVPSAIWDRYGIRSGDQPGFFRGQPDPVHIDLPDNELWGQTLVHRIIDDSDSQQVEPEAVLAVASVEGGFLGKVGDQGTSFGPFQLHRGGALPAGKGGSWANQPQGVDYALQHIGEVAGGLHGEQAIRAIVTEFEHPQDPETEIQNATNRYRAAKAQGNSRDPTQWISYPGPQNVDIGPIPTPGLPGLPDLSGPWDAIKEPFQWIGKFFHYMVWPFTHIKRTGQLLAGSFLVLIGIWMLAKGSSAGKAAQSIATTVALKGK